MALSHLSHSSAAVWTAFIGMGKGAIGKTLKTAKGEYNESNGMDRRVCEDPFLPGVMGAVATEALYSSLPLSAGSTEAMWAV